MSESTKFSEFWLRILPVPVRGAGTHAWLAVNRHRRAVSAFVLLAIPIAAHAVTLPHAFVNGTIADANEVNANLQALAYRLIPRTTGIGPGDNTDFGPIVSRTLTVAKDRSDTALRIAYTDNLGVLLPNKSCRWEIRIDGAPCPSGALVYDLLSESAFHHVSSTVTGYCNEITAGPHAVAVFVGSTPGYTGTNCYTGFNESRWVLEVEEVY